MPVSQFNTAFNAGFVTSFVGALTSYVQPITAVADEIQTTVEGNTLEGFLSVSSHGISSISQRLTAVYTAGTKGLSAINEMNKLDVLATPSGLSGAFDSILGHGVTLYSRIMDLELEFMKAYGSTAGSTADSRADLQNMNPGEVTAFYELWNQLNQTLVESGNDFTNWINQNSNAFLGSTGRPSYSYSDIQSIKNDHIALGKKVGKLAEFIQQNKNVSVKNGVAFPSPPTSTQYVAASTLYNNFASSGATLIDHSIKFAGESGIKSSLH